MITESIYRQHCHDCGSKKQLLLLTYKEDREEIDVFRCQECYNKNESLSNYKECEVFSRIVGYMRPVNNWNPGKLQEFKERKTFTA